MPGLAGRISTMTKAKVSHLLDNAEDPAETLDYAYNQQIEDLQKVKSGIEDVVTAKKRLQLQEEQLHQQAATAQADAVESEGSGRHESVLQLGKRAWQQPLKVARDFETM